MQEYSAIRTDDSDLSTMTGHEAAWRLYVDLALVASARCPF